LPKNEYEANITDWPARLQTPPNRLQSIKVDAFISRKELFKAESKYWNEIIEAYVRALHWKKIRLRNVMDMRAGFGGYCICLICFLVVNIHQGFSDNYFQIYLLKKNYFQIYLCVLQICSSID
jgi:hypothetical protein